MLDGSGRRSAAQHDWDLAHLIRLRVDGPDAEVALEGDRSAVFRDRRPQHAAVLERRDRSGRAEAPASARSPIWRATARLAGALRRRLRDACGRHDVLRAAAIGHEVERLAVAIPHRPRVLRAALRHLLIRRAAYDPDFALVEMTVSLPPPLRRGVRPRRDGDITGWRGRGEVLRRVPIGRHRHRGPAVGSDAVDIEHARDVVARRLEINRFAVRRPSAHELVGIVERQTGNLAAGQRQHVDVAVAAPRRREGEAFAVGREQRTRLGRGMRDEQVRVIAPRAARRHLPDVAAADERDRRSVRRDPRLAK